MDSLELFINGVIIIVVLYPSFFTASNLKTSHQKK